MKKILLGLGLIAFIVLSGCKEEQSNETAKQELESQTIENEVTSDETAKPNTFYKVNVGLKPDLMYNENGFKIDSVVPDRPGYFSGIKKGDIIIKLNDEKITDLNSYTMYLSNFHEKDTVLVTFLRGKNTMQTNLILD